MRRRALLPDDAPNEGARYLRILLRRMPRRTVIAQLDVHPETFGQYLRGRRIPIPAIRAVLENEFGIPRAPGRSSESAPHRLWRLLHPLQ